MKEVKELKEIKEAKEKELKEFKEQKEKDKDKDLIEGQPGSSDVVGDRLAALEQAVQQLQHFIGPELRPDLRRSALQGVSRTAKAEKDMKDAEKSSEG